MLHSDRLTSLQTSVLWRNCTFYLYILCLSFKSFTLHNHFIMPDLLAFWDFNGTFGKLLFCPRTFWHTEMDNKKVQFKNCGKWATIDNTECHESVMSCLMQINDLILKTIPIYMPQWWVTENPKNNFGTIFTRTGREYNFLADLRRTVEKSIKTTKPSTFKKQAEQNCLNFLTYSPTLAPEFYKLCFFAANFLTAKVWNRAFASANPLWLWTKRPTHWCEPTAVGHRRYVEKSPFGTRACYKLVF